MMSAEPTLQAPGRTNRDVIGRVSADANAQAGNSWREADDLRWAARHWATRIGVRLRQVHIRPMTSKWASMSTAGRLTLNPELLALPQELGEYVVVHELVHLLAPNHGKLFKCFMLAYLPDWEQREQDLRRYEPALISPDNPR